MALEPFHPSCREWFRDRFGEPTATQARAWAAIRAGRHTLIAAPTGSGKTLAAFFAVIDALVRDGLAGGSAPGARVVYVSPLKALGNDIHRNLQLPLSGIAERLERAGGPRPEISVAVRTGDTTAAERRRMVASPPHILVTTPESLYLLLTSAGGRAMLGAVSVLIVDEVHAVLGDKRGSHLALSVERLERLVRGAGGAPVQRIGLSATQRPVELVARYLVGAAGCADGEPDCEIIDSGFRRRLDLRLEVPGSPLSALMSNEVWEELYERLVELVRGHGTTLVFANTRRLSERLALALAERLGEDAVRAHHGSMSKEHRLDAERRLKAGELKALVATASMELGIDVGLIDLVVQLSSPKSVAAFLQRVGRSGHSVRGTPKAVLFPLTRDDLVESAALLRCVRRGELDRIAMPERPLDILAQQIVAEVSTLPDDGLGWDLEELRRLFAGAWPYRGLTRREFDEIVGMLAEGYSTRRGRRGALLHLDAINGRVRPRRGANLAALTNGGAIPDMFEYQVVLDPEDAPVGALNEDFALEALPGDVFTLGTHSWRLVRIDGLKVRVRDAQGMPPTVPFWLGEGPGRTRELSEAVSGLRELVARELGAGGAPAAARKVADETGLPPAAATQLAEYLEAGMKALGVMPTRGTVAMERFFDEVGDMHVVIHAPFGSRLNRGWGLALRKRFCRSFNFELQAAANEDSIVISLGAAHSFPLEEVFGYLKSATVRRTLVQALLDAPMFEVRWRWNATRALAVRRSRGGRRAPPQFQRMDAEDLIAQVFPEQLACQENLSGEREVPDHPLVRQTVHDCLTEAMDIEELEALVGRIERGELELVAKDLREPSPFAQEIINARPYAFLDDAPFEERRANAVRNRGWTDPAEVGDLAALDADAIARVGEEAWPEARNAEELHDALLGLSFMTARELAAADRGGWARELAAVGRAAELDACGGLWIAMENLPRFAAVFGEKARDVPAPAALAWRPQRPDEALREIARGRLEGTGPVTAERLAAALGVPRAGIDAALAALQAEGFVLQGRFTPGRGDGEPVEWCERRLLQRIHRYTIDAHRRRIKPVPLEAYAEFLFDRHQLLPVGADLETPALDGQTRLQNALAMLDGIAAPAVCWEADLLPARVPDYDPAWLDALCIGGRAAWGRYSPPAGRPAGRRAAGPVRTTPVTLALRANLDLWRALAGPGEAPAPGGAAGRIEADLARHGASFFDQIQARTGLLRSQLEEGLAELVSRGRVGSDGFTGLRALLVPARKRAGGRRRGRRMMFGVEDAGRWSLLDAVERPAPDREALDQERLERLVGVYLRRWGVLFRALLERESFAPPWRDLLRTLRGMELRGALRGGRFVAGVGGEQFALPETVDALRRFAGGRPGGGPAPYRCLAAADPLNLTGLTGSGRRPPRLAGNRVLYRGGTPVAALEGGEAHPFGEADASERGRWLRMLRQNRHPPRLRSYI